MPRWTERLKPDDLRALMRRGCVTAIAFARENKGATAVMFSLLTVAVTGSIAFGIDTATWYQADRKLQTGADMAAMAAAADIALQNAAGYSGDSADTIVRAALTRGGVDTAQLSLLTVNSPPSSGAFAGNSNAVEVVVSQNVPIFFAGAFVSGTPQAQARAVALAGNDGNVCVLALHPTLSSAVLFSGNSDVQLDCGIGANSTAADAVKAQGSTDVQATNVRAVGGISNNGGINAPLAPYANPVANPFSDMAVPAFSGCDSNGENQNGHATTTLNPGVYCGDVRLNAQSITTFSSGTYIFDGSDLIVNGQAKVYGTDVTFIFTNSSNPSYPGGLQLNGGSDLDLRAPTSGDFEDILFMRDPDAADVSGSNAERWIINGSSDPWLDGAIYAPGVEVEMSGSADPTGGCFVIIAGAVTFTGSVDVQMTCSGSGTEMAGVITTSLVE